MKHLETKPEWEVCATYFLWFIVHSPPSFKIPCWWVGWKLKTFGCNGIWSNNATCMFVWCPLAYKIPLKSTFLNVVHKFETPISLYCYAHLPKTTYPHGPVDSTIDKRIMKQVPISNVMPVLCLKSIFVGHAPNFGNN